MTVSWNGQLVSETELKISAFDSSFLRGEGAFETILAVGPRALRLDRHFARLDNSSKVLGVKMPDRKFLEEQIQEVLISNKIQEEARVRVTIGTNCLVTAQPLGPTKLAAKVITVSSPVNEASPLASSKCTSYAENMVIHRAAAADEALRPNTRGELCEGCLSNVFFVKDGVIHTPGISTGCLPGVMRSTILDLVSAVEGSWPIDVLDEAEEVWLSSATRRLTWVCEVNGRKLGDPSELFQETLEAIKESET